MMETVIYITCGFIFGFTFYLLSKKNTRLRLVAAKIGSRLMAGKSSDEQRKRKIVMLLFLHSFFGRGLQFASCEERSPASEQCFLVVRAGEGHLKTRRIWFII